MVGTERQSGRALPPEPELLIGDVQLHQTSHRSTFLFGFFEGTAGSGFLLIYSGTPLFRTSLGQLKVS